MKSGKGTEREKSLTKKDYLSEGYFSTKQWSSFCFQVGTVYKMIKKGTILEIGAGSGFVTSALQTIGLKTESLDVNRNLNPTFIGDISATDFKLEKKYDCVLCAEVLEHIPLEKLDLCLKNISNLSNKYVIITLPNCEVPYRLSIKFNDHSIGFKFGKRHLPIASMHFWEMNSNKLCTYDEIRRLMSKYFNILEEGRILEREYHYYYIMQVK